jgi:hypothetical protein
MTRAGDLKHLQTIAILVFAFVFAPPMKAQSVGAATAAATLQGLRSPLNGVIEEARSAGQTLLVDAALHANGMLDRIEKMLGDNIQKPLDQIDNTIRNELEAARFLVGTIVETANQLPACVGNEAELVLTSLKGGLQSALQALPFTEGKPTAFLVQASTSRAPFTVIRDPKHPTEIGLTLRGANLWTHDEVCKVTAVATPYDSREQRTSLSVKSHDAEKIILGLRPTIANGEWVVSVTAERKGRMLGCLRPTRETVSVGMKVIEPTLARVTVTVTPSCSGFAPCQRRIENSCTNGSENRNRDCTHTFGFDDPKCEYVGIENWETGGREGTVYRPTRSGNNVVVQSTADRRPRLRGGTSRVWFRGVMAGRKPTSPVLQPQQSISLLQALAPGTSVGFDLTWEPPASCELHAFTLGCQARFNDGRPVTLPEKTVLPGYAGMLSGNGLTVTLHSLTRRGTVALAANGCLTR